MTRRRAPLPRHSHHTPVRKRNAAEEKRLGAQPIYGDKVAVIYATADGNLRVALVDGERERQSWPIARTTEAIREIGGRLRGIREALVSKYGADPGPTLAAPPQRPAAPPQRPARPRIEEVPGPAWAPPPRATRLELPPNVILYDKNNPAARRVTLDWTSDRGFQVLTDQNALFNLIGTNKLKSWGFSTARDQRSGQWLPFATRKIAAVDAAILALSKSMQITPVALKELTAWKEQEQVRALAPGKAFRVEPLSSGKGYLTVGNTSSYANALMQAGWRENYDRTAFIADTLAPVQALMASNLGGDVELDPPVAEALNRFVRSLADSALATGETCTALVAPPGKAYMPFQCAGITYAMSRPATLIADEPGLGKAQPIDEPVLTPTGWRAMGNLRVGDLVIGSNGAPTRVTGVYPRGMRAAFRVTTTDGASTRCCDEHLWHVETKNDRSRDTGGRVLTLREIMDKPLKRDAAHQWFVPVPKPVRYVPQAPLPVHPYLLGALLANGGLSTGRVNYSSGDDQAALVEPLLPEGVSFTSEDRCTKRITSGQSGAKNVLLDALRDLQLSDLHSYEKFIPAAYLTASAEDRMALLQGLMDNDGTVSADGMTLEYNTTSPALASGVIELLRSLGAVAWMSTRIPKYEHKGEVREGRQDHRIRMALPDGLAPFRLPRKAARYSGRSKYAPSRAIERIEPCGECEMVCIAVEAPDHLYVTRDFLVTHNTIQAIGFINNRPDITSAIIVAPASLLTNWRRELGVWLTRPFNIFVTEDSSEAVPAGANIVVVNYEKLIDTGYTERSFGPIEKIHDVVYEGGGFRVRNTVSRVVLPKLFRKQETAAEAAQLWDRIGEPMPDGSWRGTAVTFGYWRDRMKGKRPVYYLVDPSWKPARQATDNDAPKPKETKGVRPSGVFRDLMARRWSALVIDEVHKIKMSGDKPQKTSVACLGERVYDKAAKREVIRREGLSQRIDGARIYLSGTPMPNRTIEMWPILTDLDPRTFNNFFAFAQRYAGAERTRYGWDFSGNTNSAELHDLLRGSVMVRRLKVDVLKELPAKQRQVVTLPVSVLEDAGIDLDEMLDVWDEFEAKAEEVQARMSAAILAGDRAGYEKAVNELVTLGEKPHFSQMSKMRAAIAVAKVPYVVAHVEELFEAGVECVVVMAHHHTVQDALFEAFNKSRPGSAVMHRGGMSLADKDASVVAFQGTVDGNGRAIPPRPGVRVFVGSILASGVGITLTRSHNIVFAELDWVPGNVSQAEDRVHRIGQTIPVLVQHMIVDQSIDALLINTILEKQAAADRVLDTARLPMELALQEGSAVSTTAEILLADAPAVGGTRQAESSIEQWSIATILEYSRTGVTALPLSPYDLQIVENVVRYYRFGLTPAKQRAAIGVALKIAGRVPEQVSRVATVRGPSTENEEWAARAILSLAGMDMDMARERNKVGFSASDSSNGHRLEALIAVGGMTDSDWRDAIRIAKHYKSTQVGAPPEAEATPKKTAKKNGNGRRR